MTKLPAIGRRTALKTIGAGIVGSATLTGSVNARRGRGRRPRNEVEIEAKHPDNNDDHYVFELSKKEIEAGWTDLVFDNQSGSTHFAGIYRYTKDAIEALEKRIDEDSDVDTLREAHLAEVALPFQEAWNPYWNQQIDMFQFFGSLFDEVADWFLEGGAIPVGGPGFTQGRETSRTTLNLEPGLHFMECYILDTDGIFHTTHGMVELFSVKEERSPAQRPVSNLRVSISSTEGIHAPRKIVPRPGEYTVEVLFEDNAMYGHGLGHDVHLIRLEEDTSVDDVNTWVNYLDPVPGTIDNEDTLVYGQRDALTSTSKYPGPTTWIGGVQDIAPPPGETSRAYLDVELVPGEYAWVAEVPNPQEAQPVNPETFQPVGEPVSMLETFTVGSPDQSGK